MGKRGPSSTNSVENDARLNLRQLSPLDTACSRKERYSDLKGQSSFFICSHEIIARRSVSRVLSRWKARMAIHLGRSLPNASRDRPERRRGRPARRRGFGQRRLPLLLGLAPGGVYPAAAVAGSAVRSYRTISPLPPAAPKDGTGSAVCFCGTFPGVAPAGRYPAPCLRGARTFLPPPRKLDGERPSDRLTGIIWDGAPRLSNPARSSCARC